MDRQATGSRHQINGHSNGSHTSPSGKDLYKQLIDNNDMVKELDDIEAISQQISQHAEVLYNSWKSNGMTQGPQFKLSAAQAVSPSLDHSINPLSRELRERGGTLSPRVSHNGTQHHQPIRGYHTLQHNPHTQYKNQDYADTVSNGKVTSVPGYTNGEHSQPGQGFSQNTYPPAGYRNNSLGVPPGSESSSSPRQSTASSSPSSSARESPARGSSITHITHPSSVQQGSDVTPLELLASPNLNGNLEDLVSSFVNTDRQKQAARNTISSTIMKRIGSPNGSSSPIRSPSPTPTYKGASPLRSPMLTNTVRSVSSPTSPPRSPIANMFPNDLNFPSNNNMSPISPMSTWPQQNNDIHSPMRSISQQSNDIHAPMRSISQQSNDIHAPMRSIFASNPSSPPIRAEKALPTSSSVPLQMGRSSSFNESVPLQMGRSSSFNESLPLQMGRSSSFNESVPLNIKVDADAIPIPVKHIAIGIQRPSSNEGLKSPSVLQTISKVSPVVNALARPNSDNQMPSMPNMFDNFGNPDADSSMMNMRKRFEEAKQRMGIHGGVRVNRGPGLTPMTRSMFERDPSEPMFDNMSSMGPSPWGDDPSAFLLEQFRRRNKRRMTETPAAPHPELTPQQRQHISNRTATPTASQQSVPIRRMMPGGSVAERVLMFEKVPPMFGLDKDGRTVQVVRKEADGAVSPAPVIATPWSQSLREGLREAVGPNNKIQVPKREVTVPISTDKTSSSPSVSLISPVVPRLAPSKPVPPPHTRPPSIHIPGSAQIPKFYFPNGNPIGKPNLEAVFKKFGEAFSKYKNSSVTTEEMGHILKAGGYPYHWKCPVHQAAGGEKTGRVSLAELTSSWRRLLANCHDEAAQFVALITKGARMELVPEDLVPLIQDIVDTHPGLLFLKEATEFHSRYVHTVIARIFYVVNRSWSGKISVCELRRSNFLPTLRLLQDEDDINQVTDFFSYEHFYVIYCKFWELDKDHDLFIDREDLARHNDHALSTRMIERIFCGAVTRGSAQKEGRMSYTEFVWFLLSEEDKRHATAIEYWFRCMDLDGDGVLSMYELEYFYEEQLQRMEQLGIETLPFDDCLCQMLDMILPVAKNVISLKDLKRCKMTPIFFDTFFNLEKYLDHEQRDPFATQRDTDEDGNEIMISDWERFAAEEYELLVAEEGNNEPMDELCYDDADKEEMHLEDSLDSEMIYHGEPEKKE